ncbi:MAG TPA: DinB family protein [Terriglobales bacterium]|nr:DinB family protein [Terriglobales bacterium]
MTSKTFVAVFLFVVLPVCFAKSSSSTTHASNNNVPDAQSAITISKALDYWISVTESEIVPAAEAMPEEKYSFAPTGGEFSGVRTFGQQVKHLAANNYRMAAYISGRTPSKNEESETAPAGIQSKEQIVNYVKSSFVALHGAVALIGPENMLQPLGLPFKQNTRVQLAIDAVAHSYDHYGQMVEYLRMNGIVPPASRK